MPKGSHIGDVDPLALAYVLIVFAAALLVPALIMRFSNGPSDSDADEGDGGGGGGPRRPPPEPRTPSPGGLPLDQSQPPRVRLRDDRRLGQRLPTRPRRPVREPARQPARTAPSHRSCWGQRRETARSARAPLHLHRGVRHHRHLQPTRLG